MIDEVLYMETRILREFCEKMKITAKKANELFNSFKIWDSIPSVCGERPQRAYLPTNPIATPKVCVARCRREEGIAKSYSHKPNGN